MFLDQCFTLNRLQLILNHESKYFSSYARRNHQKVTFYASEAHEHGFCVTDSEGQRPHHNLPSRLSRSQLRKKKLRPYKRPPAETLVFAPNPRIRAMHCCFLPDSGARRVRSALQMVTSCISNCSCYLPVVSASVFGVRRASTDDWPKHPATGFFS